MTPYGPFLEDTPHGNSNITASCAALFSDIQFNHMLTILSISISPSKDPCSGISPLKSCINTSLTKLYCCSQPLGECTSNVTQDGNQSSDIALKIISFVIALISMMIGTVNTARSSDAFSLEDNYLDGDSSLYRIDIFYAIYMLASGYIAMVFVGWDIAKTDSAQQLTIDKGIGSTWAKMGASWLCALLYMWTLLAHRVLGKYRNFS